MIVGVLKALFTLDASKYTAGIESVKASTKQAETAINSASKSLMGFKAKLSVVGVAAIAAGTKLARTAKELESIDHKLKFATGSTKNAQNAFQFLHKESVRLGVSLKILSKEYGNFVAASKSSNMTTEEVREVFTAVAEAAAVLRMDVSSTKLSFLALSQMMSKGVIMSEELKRQLGDHLPGAAQIMAKALGVSVKEMNKMMQTGGLLADEILPRFARVLRQEVAPGIEDLDDSLSAAIGRLSTSWHMFQRAFLSEASLITIALKGIINTMTTLIDTMMQLRTISGLGLGEMTQELDRLSDLYSDKADEVVEIEKEKQKQLYKVDYEGMQARINLQQRAFAREKQLFEQRNADVIGFFENTLDSTLSLMQDWATGGKMSFKDFADTILKDMMKVVHQALVARPIMEALRGFLDVSEQRVNPITGGMGRGNAGGFFKTLFGFIGSAFGGGQTKAFASGGIINEPVAGVGLSSGSKYTFGEAGSEAVVPMDNVKGAGSGSANNFNVTINAIDGRSLTELMRDNPQAVTIPIIDAVQGGERGLTAALRGAL